MRRKNPTSRKKHPDLFGVDTYAEIPIEKYSEADRTDLTIDDFTQEALDALEKDDPELFELVQANSEDLIDDKHVDKLVEGLRGYAAAVVEGERGYQLEAAVDWFNETVFPDGVDRIISKIRKIDDDFKELVDKVAEQNPEGLEEALSDPALYPAEWTANEYRSGAITSYHGSEINDVTIYWDELKQWLDENITEASFQEALEQIASDGFEWRLDYNPRRKRQEIKSLADVWEAQTQLGGISDLQSERVEFTLDEDAIRAVLEGLLTVDAPEALEDNKVYTYKDGFYVADLPVSALRREGAALGICVGREDMGYKRAVQAGRTKIYSIRTADGKSKFTVEASVSNDTVTSIDQIKGKANRIPGFEPGKDAGKLKVDEVEKCVEFVEHLGIDPSTIRDLKPGLRALEEWKAARAAKIAADRAAQQERRTRKNPSRPSMPKTITVSSKVAQLAAKAYSRPWGGQWGK